MAEEEKIEQHIIADRTLIRTARIISGILTPFSIPFLAFLVLFLLQNLSRAEQNRRNHKWQVSENAETVISL